MSKAKEDTLVQKDFRTIKTLVDKGKLDEVLSKIDPDNIPVTVKKVPKEVIRFMSHILNVENIDSRVKTLKADERIPIEYLLESARSHSGKEFAEAFLRDLAKDESLRREFGIDVQKVKDPLAAKIDNTINQIVTSPLLLLKSKRVNAELSFMQNDELLLRVNAELDESLLLAAMIINGASGTLQCLEENVKGVKPNINIDLCKKHLDSIEGDIREIRMRLEGFTKSLHKSRKRTTKKAKKTTKKRKKST
jgi:hypothetical protein